MRQLARDAGVVTTITAVVVGAGLAAWSVGSVVHERNQLRAQAGQAVARPTVTVTSMPADQAPAPSPRPSRTARDRTVVAAEPAARPGGGGSRTATATRRGGGSRSSTAPQPTPAPSTSAPVVQPSRCDPGSVLAIRAPLGVLPCNAITIGGKR